MKIKINLAGTIFDRTKHFILHAEYVVLRRALKRTAETRGDKRTVAGEIGLIIIYPKCMINGMKNGNKPEEIEIIGQRYV